MTQTVVNTDNSSALANSLFSSLTAGISVPANPDFSADKFNFDPLTDSTTGLYTDIVGATLAEVTEGNKTLEGSGSFDVFMQALDKHLEREFKGNRITGSQYAEVYTAVANQALGLATNFTLQKDQARWNSVTAQMQARIAEIQATVALVELEKAKIETAESNFKLNLTAAQYALTKMQLASEEARHDGITVDNAMKEYNLNFMLPVEYSIKTYERTAMMPSTVAMNEFQVDRILPAQASISEYQNRVLQPIEKALQELQLNRVVPAQADLLEFDRDSLKPVELAQQQHVLNLRMPQETNLIKEQVETQRANTLDTRVDGLTPISGVVGLQKRNLTSDADIKDYNLSNTLPTQLTLLGKQITLTAEQSEAERSKTLNTRSDGVTTITGSVGKQKDLYTQQIDSFIKDAQHKTAKLFSDAWVTQKTLDEGLTAPTQFTNNEINEVLAAIRLNNNLGS